MQFFYYFDFTRYLANPDIRGKTPSLNLCTFDTVLNAIKSNNYRDLDFYIIKRKAVYLGFTSDKNGEAFVNGYEHQTGETIKIEARKVRFLTPFNSQ